MKKLKINKCLPKKLKMKTAEETGSVAGAGYVLGFNEAVRRTKQNLREVMNL